MEALGDDTDAVATYEKAIALNEARKGTFASAHVNLSAYYNRTGDSAQGARVRAQGTGARPQVRPRLVSERRGPTSVQGDWTMPSIRVNRAIALNPRASSYYYVLAGLYRRLGKMEESRKALESFTRLERETNELEKMRRLRPSPRSAPRSREATVNSGLRSGAVASRVFADDGPGRGGVDTRARIPNRLVARPSLLHPVVFTDVTAAAGLLRATNISGSAGQQAVPARGDGLRRGVLRL